MHRDYYSSTTCFFFWFCSHVASAAKLDEHTCSLGTTYINIAKKEWSIYEHFRLRNPVLQKVFQSKRATSIVAYIPWELGSPRTPHGNPLRSRTESLTKIPWDVHESTVVFIWKTMEALWVLHGSAVALPQKHRGSMRDFYRTPTSELESHRRLTGAWKSYSSPMEFPRISTEAPWKLVHRTEIGVKRNPYGSLEVPWKSSMTPTEVSWDFGNPTKVL